MAHLTTIENLASAGYLCEECGAAPVPYGHACGDGERFEHPTIALLRRLEWRGAVCDDYGEHPICPCCRAGGAEGNGAAELHAVGCDLAKIIGSPREEV